jgi:GntR family transcriptional repressor for pyruvate dehydrogenase complex
MPVRSPSTVDAIVDQIVDLIVAGRLDEGDLLPGERQLAAMLSVSRQTLRDAVEVLARHGVVSVTPGPAGGTRVASIWIPPSLTGPTQPPPPDELFETLEARRAVEPCVAQLAALRGTEEDFRVMQETIALQRANQHDRVRVNQGNLRFHRQMWRAGGNDQLEATLRVIYRKLNVPFDVALRDDARSQRGIDLHVETLDAIMLGDSAKIAETMDRHLAYLEELCEQVFRRPRLRQVPAFLLGPASRVSQGI